MAIFTFLPKSGPYLAHFAPVPSGPGGARDPNFFFKVGNRPQEAMQKNFLEFSPPISDICLYHHFWNQLKLPFSELNITPSVRPNLGIFKNFWYWISIFRQSSWVKKTQFELNLTSFKWASPRSALMGLPRLGWEKVLFTFEILEIAQKTKKLPFTVSLWAPQRGTL